MVLREIVANLGDIHIVVRGKGELTALEGGLHYSRRFSPRGDISNEQPDYIGIMSCAVFFAMHIFSIPLFADNYVQHNRCLVVTSTVRQHRNCLSVISFRVVAHPSHTVNFKC